MAWNRICSALVCGAAASLLSGCGGGGSDSASSAPPPITVTPPPLTTPPPPPPPSASTGWLVGAVPGETLGGLMACAIDPVQRDAAGHVTGLAALTGAKIDNSLSLLFRDADSYSLNVNGFGGSSFAPADKRSSPTLAFDYFLKPGGDEFYLARANEASGSRTFATHGLYTGGGVCFFAVGLPASPLPTSGTGDYIIIADGLARIGGQNLRLLPSYTGSSLIVDYQTGKATLTLVLGGKPNAFEEFADKPVTAITTVTASLQRIQGSAAFGTADISGGGFTGKVAGQLVGNTANVSGLGGAGAVFSFELRNTAGEVIFGVATAERSMI